MALAGKDGLSDVLLSKGLEQGLFDFFQPHAIDAVGEPMMIDVGQQVIDLLMQHFGERRSRPVIPHGDGAEEQAIQDRGVFRRS